MLYLSKCSRDYRFSSQLVKAQVLSPGARRKCIQGQEAHAKLHWKYRPVLKGAVGGPCSSLPIEETPGLRCSGSQHLRTQRAVWSSARSLLSTADLFLSLKKSRAFPRVMILRWKNRRMIRKEMNYVEI